MRKKLIASYALLMVLGFSNVFAGGMPVFDVSGWLAAIDQVYQQYDMIMNTITQIENQYNMINQQVERAKAIDWNNITFDGDFDIRNDIRDATKRVNRLLTSARNIKNLMTKPSITCGNVRYSIADLVGAGTTNNDDLWENDKNLLTACKDYSYYMQQSMQTAIKDVTEGLTPEQRKAIWVKYGISPQNYAFVQQSVNAVKKQCSEIFAKCSEEARQMKLEEIAAQNNTILKAALEDNLDSNGNPTEAGMQEAALHLSDKTIEQLAKLGFSIDDLCNLTAAKMIDEQNKAQEEQARTREQQELDDNKHSSVSSRFKK